MIFQQKFQNPAARWRKLQLVRDTISLGNSDHIVDAISVIMLFKSNSTHATFPFSLALTDM